MTITLPDVAIFGAMVSLVTGSYAWTYKISKDLRAERKEDYREYQETNREIFNELRQIQGKLNRLMGQMDLQTRNDEE